VADHDVLDDAHWMRRAIELAWSARPSPNPRVGSVVVRDGAVVGEGAHQLAGQDHAEIIALRGAGERAAGATAYITLEPHSFHGRTPPCTDALVAARVARVVLGVRDPNPRVSGRGIEQLRAAGVDVTIGVEQSACESLVRGWSKFVTRGTPFVVLKVGMSLDGRIATRTRESRWITGPEARRDGHVLRARADAVLVGVGTVLSDDPLLTPRNVPVAGRLPARIVLDTVLRTPLDAALVRSANDAPTWIVHADDADPARAAALTARGVETIAVPRREGHVSVVDALRRIAERGVIELLCEGGGAIHGAMLDARAADAVVCYVAPMIIGGRDAFAAFGGDGVQALVDAHRLRDVSVERIGADIRLSAEFEHVHRDHQSDR
jgi:diaminohydroxyphosphoribosylaminopyrimidine deaminase/5-amino-6-(5-phosphoribosylamino)uracil reductase